DAVNSFRYVAPKSLPDEGPADALSREPHSFSRVVTGACWDVLVRLSLAGNGSDRLAVLQKAAQDLGRLVAAAAERTAPTATFFRRFATELRKAASGDSTTNAAVTRALTSPDPNMGRRTAPPSSSPTRSPWPSKRAATSRPPASRARDRMRKRMRASSCALSRGSGGSRRRTAPGATRVGCTRSESRTSWL